MLRKYVSYLQIYKFRCKYHCDHCFGQRRTYLFLAVFGLFFWTLAFTVSHGGPFCFICELIASMEHSRLSIGRSIEFSWPLNNDWYRGFLSMDVEDVDDRSSSTFRDRLRVVINLLFADLILRRRASVPSRLSPAIRQSIFMKFTWRLTPSSEIHCRDSFVFE